MAATQPAQRNATRGKVKKARVSGPRGRTAAPRRRARSTIRRLEDELPTELRDFSRRVRRDLTHLERRIEHARKDARRGLTRILRDVSHELGRLEAQGERRWRRLTNQARRDAVRALRKLEKAIEPPKRKRRALKKAPVADSAVAGVAGAGI